MSYLSGLEGFGGGVGIRYVGDGLKSPSPRILPPAPLGVGRGDGGIRLLLMGISFLWFYTVVVPKISGIFLKRLFIQPFLEGKVYISGESSLTVPHPLLESLDLRLDLGIAYGRISPLNGTPVGADLIHHVTGVLDDIVECLPLLRGLRQRLEHLQDLSQKNDDTPNGGVFLPAGERSNTAGRYQHEESTVDIADPPGGDFVFPLITQGVPKRDVVGKKGVTQENHLTIDHILPCVAQKINNLRKGDRL